MVGRTGGGHATKCVAYFQNSSEREPVLLVLTDFYECQQLCCRNCLHVFSVLV